MCEIFRVQELFDLRKYILEQITFFSFLSLYLFFSLLPFLFSSALFLSLFCSRSRSLSIFTISRCRMLVCLPSKVIMRTKWWPNTVTAMHRQQSNDKTKSRESITAGRHERRFWFFNRRKRYVMQQKGKSIKYSMLSAFAQSTCIASTHDDSWREREKVFDWKYKLLEMKWNLLEMANNTTTHNTAADWNKRKRNPNWWRNGLDGKHHAQLFAHLTLLFAPNW